jgi:hypothetical protein
MAASHHAPTVMPRSSPATYREGVVRAKFQILSLAPPCHDRKLDGCQSRDQDAGQNKTASLEEALKAVTIYPAQQQGMQEKIGTIEVGKCAVLVVLDKDITDVAPRDLSDIKVLGAVMNGRFTHCDGL